jgi:hypothetical protein
MKKIMEYSNLRRPALGSTVRAHIGQVLGAKEEVGRVVCRDQSVLRLASQESPGHARVLGRLMDAGMCWQRWANHTRVGPTGVG